MLQHVPEFKLNSLLSLPLSAPFVLTWVASVGQVWQDHCLQSQWSTNLHFLPACQVSLHDTMLYQLQKEQQPRHLASPPRHRKSVTNTKWLSKISFFISESVPQAFYGNHHLNMVNHFYMVSGYVNLKFIAKAKEKLVMTVKERKLYAWFII